jgi:flagellar secretion chaperone FliS
MSERGIDAYRKIDIKARVEAATPGQLVALLFEGLLTSLVEARTAILEGDYQLKGQKISKSLSIILTLRESLDVNVESDLPYNIERLYDYMQRRLLDVNQSMDVAVIDEVVELVVTLKSGWDQIVDPR